jgi:molecular chaperone HscA
MLFQISEPGMTPEPHQRKLAAGIDLGTTNSLIATIRSSSPEVLADDKGVVLLPSVVHYAADGSATVGTNAFYKQVQDPVNTIASVKRFMGRGRDEIGSATQLRYELDEGPGQVRIKTVAGLRSPVQVSADILAVLKTRAQESLGGELEGVVITVPAYFDDAQRQATKDAGRLAGLNVLRLLNEPTAAAVAYGLDQGSQGIYAVYDLGGGTFDISILRLTKGVFEVMATGGDSALGGDDFDELVVQWMQQEGQLKPLSDSAARQLRMLARQAKELLTEHEQVPIQKRLEDGQSIDLVLSRAHFDAMVLPLMKRTTQACKKALRDAEIKVDDCAGVVLVGGSTRMPIVRSSVAQLFGKEPLCQLNPDTVVALGAAIQANALVGNKQADEDWLLLDVIPLSLGIETYGGIVEKVVPRNSTLPIARAQEFTTFKDGQTAMAIHAVQGERELAGDCRSLARFELRGIPPMAAGAAKIRVTFQVDADGLLNVQAQELTSGIKAQIDVKPSYGLSDDEISTMLSAGYASASQDMKARALAEQQVEAERLLEAIRSAMRADADLLSQTDQDAIYQALDQLNVAREHCPDHLQIKQQVDHVAQLTENFAALRMDRAVKQALAGKRIDEITPKVVSDNV